MVVSSVDSDYLIRSPIVLNEGPHQGPHANTSTRLFSSIDIVTGVKISRCILGEYILTLITYMGELPKCRISPKGSHVWTLSFQPEVCLEVRAGWRTWLTRPQCFLAQLLSTLWELMLPDCRCDVTGLLLTCLLSQYPLKLQADINPHAVRY